jgi:ABC-type enterobactin transport system permease subunit
VALAMMIGGLATAIVWRQLGWHEQIYEGMPGILAGLGIYLLLARPVLAHA